MAEDGKTDGRKFRQLKSHNSSKNDDTLTKNRVHHRTMVIYILYKFDAIPFVGYLVMAEDMSWTDGQRQIDGWLRMGLLPPPREFCRHILSCRELKAESFKRCLHSVLRGVSL